MSQVYTLNVFWEEQMMRLPSLDPFLYLVAYDIQYKYHALTRTRPFSPFELFSRNALRGIQSPNGQSRPLFTRLD